MSYLKISLGIFVVLAASRFIPHPPNFTSLIALGFYIPLLFGIRFLPILILSFAITDYFIGFHSQILFTWGSIIVIGLFSRFYDSGVIKRVAGTFVGCCIFFIITNFGVWSEGSYGYTFEGLLLCYTLAIPFFAYNVISTFIFSGIFELIIKSKIIKSIKFKEV